MPRTSEPEWWRRERRSWAWLMREHGVGARLAFGGVGGRDRVDDGLGFFVADFCAVEGCLAGCASVADGNGCRVLVKGGKGVWFAHVDSTPPHSAGGCAHCYVLSGRSSNRA